MSAKFYFEGPIATLLMAAGFDSLGVCGGWWGRRVAKGHIYLLRLHPFVLLRVTNKVWLSNKDTS